MHKKLSKDAYGGVAGKDYVPYISNGSKFGGNVAVLIIGIILAALFAASTAYSGMKSGLTVAAGIPGSIIGSAFIAAFAKQKGILGKNLLQGMSSGGESVASGMIFVLPAVLLIGSKVSFLEGFLVGVGGVLFGIGIASLVYNYLLVEEHGKLMYPESMAISETLVASEGAGESLKYMGIGFGISGILTVITGSFLNIANNVVSYVNETFYKWKFEIEVNPLLLGIGFIVGLEVSLTMFAGSLLANFGIMPLIGYFASFAKDGVTVWNNPSVAINAMKVKHIAGSYVKYIGAGMMLSGGLIGAIKLIPTIVSSIKETLNAKATGAGKSSANLILIGGLVIGFIAGFLVSGGNILMAITASVLSLFLSLLFVIVSGRLTGTIGTSNLPVSGMTIASLVLVTLLFVVMGWKSPANNRSLLLFGTFIVIAISIAGGYCQSQKVNFIIGGDRREMDRYFAIASIVGVAVVVGVILLLSSKLAMTGDNVPFALPQANLMSTLTAGIMSGQLPWPMIITGVVMGIVLYFLNLPIMTVAIGFYLPISTTSIILIGALVRLFIEKTSKFAYENLKAQTAAVLFDNGNDYSSGLAQNFKSNFEKLGGKVVASENYNKGEQDFNAQLTKLKALNPQVLFLPDYYGTVALIAKQARALGITSTFVGGDGWDSSDLFKIGGEAVNGAYFSNHYSPEDTSKEVVDFKKSYEDKYKTTPDTMAVLNYDAGKILVEAIKAAGKTDGESIKEALKKTNVTVVSGKVSFDEKRNAVKSAVIVKVEGDKTKFTIRVNP